MITTKEELLASYGDFSWDFGRHFIVEVKSDGKTQHFIWSDPSYNGSNTFVEIDKSFKQIVKYLKVPMVRSKGVHLIESYCGSDIDVTFLNRS